VADKLSIYNGAVVQHIGDRRIISLTDDVKTRYACDYAWTSAVNACLEQGEWKFALRSVQLYATTDVVADFGYTNAFDKPTDWVRTVAISQDENMNVPLSDFIDESKYWWSYADPIYVRFVSNKSDYGLNVGAWSQSFADYVSAELALRISLNLNQSKSGKEDIEKNIKRLKVAAVGINGVSGPAKRLPGGRLMASRRTRSNDEPYWRR